MCWYIRPSGEDAWCLGRCLDEPRWNLCDTGWCLYRSGGDWASDLDRHTRPEHHSDWARAKLLCPSWQFWQRRREPGHCFTERSIDDPVCADVWTRFVRGRKYL